MIDAFAGLIPGWECSWLPLDQLADTDVRPGSLKTALLAVGDGRIPFWHAWNG